MQATAINNDSSKNIVSVIAPQEFAFLFILSFGMYSFCWMYRVWSYYRERNQLDISPFWRASFSLFFIYSLVEKLENHARSIGSTISVQALTVTIVYFGAIVAINTEIWYLEIVGHLVGFGIDLLLLDIFNSTIKNTENINIVPFVPTAGEWIVIAFGASLLFLSLYTAFLF